MSAEGPYVNMNYGVKPLQMRKYTEIGSKAELIDPTPAGEMM